MKAPLLTAAFVSVGIVGMCKEHMGVALALKVPVFFVVTKVDICPEHVLKHTLATLQAILKKPGVKKKPFMVRDQAFSSLTLMSGNARDNNKNNLQDSINAEYLLGVSSPGIDEMLGLIRLPGRLQLLKSLNQQLHSKLLSSTTTSTGQMAAATAASINHPFLCVALIVCLSMLCFTWHPSYA